MTCKFCRYVNHTLVWRPSYKRIFNEAWLNAITQAIAASEAQHDAQIGIIAEHTLPYSYLRRGAPVRERAVTLFGKHRFWDTERNTGVLIYINVVERAVELIADRGVAPMISQSQWDAWADKLRAAYASAEYTQSTIRVINEMGRVFAKTNPKVNQSSELSSLVADRPQVL